MALLRRSGRGWRAPGRRFGAAWVALGLALAPPARAEGALEYAVKAAYLYKFAPFVDWPSSAFAAPTSPFTVCVFGEDPFGGALEEAVRGQSVVGRRVLVRRLGQVSGDPGCQVLYVGRSSRQPPAEVLRILRGAPVLTVTDEAQGVSGGIVQFVLRGGHVRFALDAEQARVSGLGLSSKLLALAVSVRRSGG